MTGITREFKKDLDGDTLDETITVTFNETTKSASLQAIIVYGDASKGKTTATSTADLAEELEALDLGGGHKATYTGNAYDPILFW
jgi:hypothetical protein